MLNLFQHLINLNTTNMFYTTLKQIQGDEQLVILICDNKYYAKFD